MPFWCCFGYYNCSLHYGTIDKKKIDHNEMSNKILIYNVKARTVWANLLASSAAWVYQLILLANVVSGRELSWNFLALQFTLASCLKFSFTKTSVHFTSFSFTLFLQLRVHYVSLYRKFASQSLVSLPHYRTLSVKNFATFAMTKLHYFKHKF